MGIFIFLLLLFFIIIPLFKVIWRVWQVQRSFSRMQQQARDAMNRAAGASAQARRADRQSAARRPRKKIDPTVGEYVAFEEVHAPAASGSASDGDGAFRAEPQVEDAVWEEIK